MLVDFARLLERKYDILQQQADTSRIGMQAAATLDTVKAGLLPNESAANIGLAKANTARVAEETKTIAPLAQAQIGESGSRARANNAQALGAEQLTTLTPMPFKFQGLDDLEKALRVGLRFGMGPFAQ